MIYSRELESPNYLDLNVFLRVTGAELIVLQVSRKLGHCADQNRVIKVYVFQAIGMCANSGYKAF